MIDGPCLHAWHPAHTRRNCDLRTRLTRQDLRAIWDAQLSQLSAFSSQRSASSRWFPSALSSRVSAFSSQLSAFSFFSLVPIGSQLSAFSSLSSQLSAFSNFLFNPITALRPSSRQSARGSRLSAFSSQLHSLHSHHRAASRQIAARPDLLSARSFQLSAFSHILFTPVTALLPSSRSALSFQLSASSRWLPSLLLSPSALSSRLSSAQLLLVVSNVLSISGQLAAVRFSAPGL